MLPHILWTAQSDGRIDYLSAAYTSYTGLDHQGDYETWLDALHPDDVERCKAAWENAIRIGKDYSIEFRVIHRASGQYRWQAVNAQPVRDAGGQIAKWYGICIDIHDTMQARDEATALAGRLQTTLECMSDAFFMLDREWRFAYLNSAAERELHCRSEELLGRPIWEKYPRQENEHFYRQYRRAIAGNCAVRFEEFDPTLNKWFELNVHPSELGLSIYFRDITERKQAALDLERTSRGLRMLSRANAALVRIDDETELLQEICQVALEGGDYRAAWTGIAQDDAAHSIKICAWSGDEGIARYIKDLKLSWSPDTPFGCGPTGRAIRENRPFLFSDTLSDPDFGPWRKEAEQNDYLSGVCLPLRDKRRNFGVLVLVNYGKRAMSDDEVRLLQELAENLSFGIAHIRAQQNQRKIEAAVLKVAASISHSCGTEFFRSLAVSMVEALGAQGAFLSRLSDDKAKRANVIAGILDGRHVENIEYETAGMPCEYILDSGTHLVEKGVFQVFPRMAAAMPPDVVACAGHRLDNAQGKALGTLFVVFREKIEHPEFIRSVMQIFAARAASEMERQEKDAQIHYQASLIDKARDAMVARDIEHRIIFWNKGAERLYGWRREEVLGRSEAEFSSEPVAAYHHIVEQVLLHGKWNGEQTKRHRDGSTVIVDGSWTLVTDEHGQPQSIFSIHTDISDRKAAENEIQRLAFYDQLTCLPNRQLLRVRGAEAR